MFEHVIGRSKRLIDITTTQMKIQRNIGAAFVFEMLEIGKGARGLKHFVHYSFGSHRFNFVKHLGGVPDMDEFHLIINRIKGFKWHVVMHFDAIDLVTHEKLLDGLPIPYIIDHMGRVPTKDGLDQQPFKILLEFAKRDNCWIKVCGAERISSNGPPFTDAIPFAKALIQTAPDRVLWGTDWPHPNIKEHMPNDGNLVDLIPLMAETPALQQKLLVDNAHRLYGFSN